MTPYEKELQELKPHDEIQGTEICRRTNYPFIYTAGHGYLAIPLNDLNSAEARNICMYGFKCKLTIYLEED